MKILFTGSIADIIATEAWFQDYERSNISHIYHTISDNSLSEMFDKLPNFPKLKNFTKILDNNNFFNFKCQILQHNSLLCPVLDGVEDFGIEAKLPEIINDKRKYTYSSFSRYKLCDISQFNLPNNYIAIFGDFEQKTWDNILKFLEHKNIIAVVIESKNVPESKILLNLININFIESLEIVKQAKGFIGIESCYSILSSKCYNNIMLKTCNENTKTLYYYQVDVDFLYKLNKPSVEPILEKKDFTNTFSNPIGTARVITYNGFGDTIYQRPIIEQLFKRYSAIYLETSWPQLFWDFEEKYNLKFLKPNCDLRSQNRNITENGAKYVDLIEFDCEINLQYATKDAKKNISILTALANSANIELPKNLDFSLPIKKEWQIDAKRILNRINNNFNKPIALIKPCSLRTEWLNEARNCKPEYIDLTIQHLKKTHYTVCFADVEEGKEWLEGEYYPDQFIFDYYPITTWIGLLPRIDLLVGPVSFILPLGAATNKKTFIIFGGWMKPHIIFDKINTPNIKFIAPKTFCNCLKSSHQCNKDIDEQQLLTSINDINQNKNLIYLHTPMHTAGMFVMNLLQKHSLYKDAWSITNFIQKNVDYKNNGFYILQHHHTREKVSRRTGQKFFTDAFVTKYKTIITMRDPILSLITQRNRLKKEKSNASIIPHIDSLTSAISLLVEKNVVPFCVDVPKTSEEKVEYVNNFLEKLNLPLDPNNDNFWDIVKKWEKRNRFSDEADDLLEAYKNKDLKYLVKNLEGVSIILNRKENFSKWLKELGFKDLFWW